MRASSGCSTSQKYSRAANCGLAQGKGGRVDAASDLTLGGDPGVYVVGDIANIRDSDGSPLPQLGSVALQSGKWAADNILAAGQTMLVNGTAGASKLGLLESSSNGASSGPITMIALLPWVATRCAAS